MKIDRVTIKNFKCFGEQTFDLDDYAVIAGPNNSGKTTLLQAIAAWHLVLWRWREMNDYQRHGGAYTKIPITRQTFYSVPLRTFDMLWHKHVRKPNTEITLRIKGVDVTVEVFPDSPEHVYARPSKKVAPEWLKDANNIPQPMFVPAMAGLCMDEPVYQQPKIDQLLGQGKSGDVLRNLLALANEAPDVWDSLRRSIQELFDYDLLPPNTYGAHIIADYRAPEGQNYDIASAGSGFHQVLMLLIFLKMHPRAVLMLDEPNTHLHTILRDAIYNELRRSARENNSQLIVATHSEAIINATGPKNICALSGTPIKLSEAAPS